MTLISLEPGRLSVAKLKGVRELASRLTGTVQVFLIYLRASPSDRALNGLCAAYWARASYASVKQLAEKDEDGRGR